MVEELQPLVGDLSQPNMDVSTVKTSAGRQLRTRVCIATFRGGIPGAMAMMLNVVLLMWMRTVVNYQYKTGLPLLDAFSQLYSEGGIPRFYQGLTAALLQAPLSRFGDTAANEGVKELLRDRGLSVVFITLTASVIAGCWRVAISPIDTVKTTMQVHGCMGMANLGRKMEEHGVLVLFTGSFGAWLASIVAYYPWYYTYNFLDACVKPRKDSGKIIRSAGLGLVSAMISDTISNSIRVVKTVAQTSEENIGYHGALAQVLNEGGLSALFFRGLPAKLVSNAIQSAVFTVFWRYLQENEVFECKSRHNSFVSWRGISAIVCVGVIVFVRFGLDMCE
eukprot:m.87788 g.87788  ORF g.87788 m.87788 type:complete len:335 (-) comp26118_c0_seq1:420-1424(-)